MRPKFLPPFEEAKAFSEIPHGGWIVDGVRIHHPDAYSDWECWLNHVLISIPKIDKAFEGKNFGVRWYLPTIMALNAKCNAEAHQDFDEASGCNLHSEETSE